MRCKILDKNANKYAGLNEEVFYIKPVNETNFRFPIEIKFNEEPDNIFEEIKSLFDVVVEVF